MPIRVFDGQGTASTADVIEAIYFAADNGANIINMSFSMPESSRELKRAVRYAKQAGLVSVSSAGNQGSSEMTYPAGLGKVIGVASTDMEDRLSSFSSYGSALASLGAPGEALVSFYPGGLYAGGWGTSFSSALVAGAVALLHEITLDGQLDPVSFAQAKHALRVSADAPDLSVPADSLGWGLLDAQEAFFHGLASPCHYHD